MFILSPLINGLAFCENQEKNSSCRIPFVEYKRRQVQGRRHFFIPGYLPTPGRLE
jgi:hypothetical protein